MLARVRPLLVCLFVLIVGGAILLFQQPSAAVTYTGYGSVTSGPLNFELSLVPPVAQPGEHMTLSAHLTNTGASAVTPSIIIKLPHGVAGDVSNLPSGVTLNLQDGTLTWAPSVGPLQTSRDLTIDLTVQTVEVNQPEQPVQFYLRDGVQERQGETLVWIGIPPIVNAVSERQTVAVGQPLTLQAGVSGPGPITQLWDLGDGRRLTVNEPEVAFALPGDYSVWVEASNPVGSARRKVEVSVVANPVAAFQPDDDNPGVGQTVTFQNSSGGLQPLRIFWDFGDGTISEASDPQHAYQSPGTYQVRQRVENDFGLSEAFWTINVGEAPVADMILMDRTAVGQALQGQALGDAVDTEYTWDMGDGREESGPAMSHLYRLPGDYYVRLVASNPFSITELGRWVRVDPGTTTFYMPSVFFGSTNAADSVPLGADFPTDVVIDSPDIAPGSTFTVPELSFPEGTTPPEELFSYLNEVRAQFNLPPLAYVYELSRSAQEHANNKTRQPDDPHTGTDGSTPAERLLRAGYRGGYAGEATAWGFATAREAVEFWMNSEPHRKLILNLNTNDVGVGFVEDYSSQNIWHWTADLGLSYGAPLAPTIRLQSPAAGIMVADSDVVNYAWLWPVPLAADQYFSVYILKNDLAILVGTVNQPVSGSRYVLSADSASRLLGQWDDTETLANTQWFVRLEDGRGAKVADASGRSIIVQRTTVAGLDDSLATPGTGLPLIATQTAVPSPTPEVQPTNIPATEPPPPVEPPPLIVTATPQP